MEVAVENGDHSTRLALLERGQADAKEALTKAEERLCRLIQDVRTTIMDEIKSLSHVIEGNGKPGIVGRVIALEEQSAVNRAQAIRGDRMWSRFTPWIPYIMLALGAAAMYYIGPKRG